jgi:hypothetical protein
VTFHLLLLVMIISWKPPAVGQFASAIEVSLVSGTGRTGLAALPATLPAPKPDPIDPKPTPSDASSVEAKAAANLGSSLLLKPKLEPPKDLTPMVVNMTSGGPSLTAQPLSITSHPAQAASLPLQAAGGKSCQILETLKLGLQGSAAVKAALLLIPAQSLSVSKAIVLWDGHWIDSPSVGGSSNLAPIKEAVLQVVGQAPPICQVELLRGVRFITLGDARDTTVLAFGSNAWRWIDVLATLSPTTSK